MNYSLWSFGVNWEVFFSLKLFGRNMDKILENVVYDGELLIVEYFLSDIKYFLVKVYFFYVL